MTLFRLTVLVLALALAGCTQMAGKREPQTVEQRAAARWQALIAGDWEAAYAMLSPGYRSATPYDAYRARMLTRKIEWTSAEVSKVDCEDAETCTVTVTIRYVVPQGLPGVSKLGASGVVEEAWLNLDGRWYHLPSRTTG
jgi:hypothetical protein